MVYSHRGNGALHRFICLILLHLNSTLSSAAYLLWVCRVLFSTVALVGAQQGGVLWLTPFCLPQFVRLTNWQKSPPCIVISFIVS